MKIGLVNGVYLHKPTGKWNARIPLDGRRKHLGSFDRFDDAVMSRYKAEKRFKEDFEEENSSAYKYLIEKGIII